MAPKKEQSGMDFIVRPKNEGLGFQLEAVSEVIKLEFEQRKLLAELVTTSPPSVSMRRPSRWNDITFSDAAGRS